MKTTILTLAILLTATVASAADKAPAAKPAATKVATGQDRIATCRDGKEYWSASTDHRGACSGHGGVAAWADGTPVKSGGKSTSYR